MRRRSLPLTRDLVIDMVRRARKRRRRLTALRDAAILLLFHHSALRCSELAGIRVQDITWSPQGILLAIPRSKGDQYGEGQHVAIEADPDQYLCPVRALRAWLDEAHIEVGYVFRWIHPTGHGGPVQLPDRPLTHSSFNHYVKEYAAEIGLDPTDYTTRSMRSGYATTLGAPEKARCASSARCATATSRPLPVTSTAPRRSSATSRGARALNAGG